MAKEDEDKGFSMTPEQWSETEISVTDRHDSGISAIIRPSNKNKLMAVTIRADDDENTDMHMSRQQAIVLSNVLRAAVKMLDKTEGRE